MIANGKVGQRIYTQKQLEARLAYWQKRLHLQDWVITIEIVAGWKMSDKNAGEVDQHAEKRLAAILLCEPEEVLVQSEQSPVPWAYDMEYVLVHELMHIVLGPLSRRVKDGDDPETQLAEEQAVHALATALVHNT